MSEWIQTLIVAAAVMSAAAFITRKYVVKKKGAQSGACGSCGSCGSNNRSKGCK